MILAEVLNSLIEFLRQVEERNRVSLSQLQIHQVVVTLQVHTKHLHHEPYLVL